MSDEERKALSPGDTVVVRNDHGYEEQRVVKYSPWQLAHGEWLIGLKGIAGGYLLSRVIRKATA